VFDGFHGWAELFRLPIEERKRLLGDPELRKRLDEGARSEASGVIRQFANWGRLVFGETFSPQTRRFQGRTVADVAAELGKAPFDAMLDVALADDLRTSFCSPRAETSREDWELMRSLWLDERTILGASDAGAHLDMLDTFATTTQVLGSAVREQGVLGLELAVRELTDVPARLYGLRESGRIAPGWRADLVIFDEREIGCGPTYTRRDLPAGAGRLYADARGIAHVLVNGTEIVRNGESTGALPGTVLRSGRDTETVALASR
jgi:N-acyl-D-aspartate/D-glutamate deacylase